MKRQIFDGNLNEEEYGNLFLPLLNDDHNIIGVIPLENLEQLDAIIEQLDSLEQTLTDKVEDLEDEVRFLKGKLNEILIS